MSQTQKFLTLAAAEAELGMKRRDGGPFGAVIVRNGRILAKGHNTVLRKNDPTSHAEVNAIRKASRKKKTPFFEDCIMYSTTEPCPMCFAAIHWARVKKVVFSSTIREAQHLGFNEMTLSNHKLKKWGNSPVLIKQVRNKACSNLFKIWRSLPKKTTY